MNEINYEDLLGRSIRSITIPNKEKLYKDLFELKQVSWSDRIVNDSISFLNTFLQESVECLINSVALFEMGYYDSAFYNLRSAIDLSTTQIFLSEMPDDERIKNYKSWTRKEKFPLRAQICDELNKKVDSYKDLRIKMIDFFGDGKGKGFIANTSNALNKHVHKQGFSEFFVVRNHPLWRFNHDDACLTKDFLNLFKRTITITLVMRLAIDPLPLILMEDEALYRYPDSMIDAFPEELTNKYLDNDIISNFKKSKIFNEVRDWILSMEKCEESTFNVIKWHIIDRKYKDIFEKQYHLMNECDKVMISVACASLKIVSLIRLDWLFPYFTEISNNAVTARTDTKVYFDALERDGDVKNAPFKNTYFSIFTINGHSYCIDTYEPFDDKEISQLESVIKEIEQE